MRKPQAPPTQVAIAEPSKAASVRSGSIAQVGDTSVYEYIQDRRNADTARDRN